MRTHLFYSRLCVLVLLFFFFFKKAVISMFLTGLWEKKGALQRSAAKDSPFVSISQVPFILNQRANKPANASGTKPSSINLKKLDGQKQVLPRLYIPE